MTAELWQMWWSGFWSGAGCLGAIELVGIVWTLWVIRKR